MSTSSHPILLAALDLDGTLLNSNGEVSPCTQKVLSEASDRGVVVIPATGRPLASLPPVVAKQPWVHYALTSNGAAVWDLGGDPLGCVYSRYANAAEHETSQPECIVRRCFPVEKAREVYEAFQGLPGGLNIFSDGRALRDMAQQRFFDERFARLAAALDAMSPLKVLGRGYALAQTANGKVATSVDEVEPGGKLSVRLSDGVLDCRVDDKRRLL